MEEIITLLQQQLNEIGLTVEQLIEVVEEAHEEEKL